MNSENELFDIEPLWHVPFWQTPQFFWVVVSVGICLVLIIVLVIFKKWYFKKRIQLPWERALADLAYLKENNQVSVRYGKEFYCALTRIIKVYLHDRYNLDVVSVTDEELRTMLDQYSALESDIPSLLVTRVHEVMDGMVFIKFANQNAAQKKIEDDFCRVEQIIQDSIPKSKNSYPFSPNSIST